MTSPRQRFADFSAAQSRRGTAHMARVVDAACAQAGIFTHDDVLKELSATVSRVTVVRTIERFLEAGMVRPVPSQGGSAFVNTTLQDSSEPPT
jgi:Fe2+ or Zn2+ uptake regulation protein